MPFPVSFPSLAKCFLESLFAFEALPLQTSGTLLLLPFFLVDKGFIARDMPVVSPRIPVAVLGNRILETTESETLAFIHIRLSLSQ